MFVCKCAWPWIRFSVCASHSGETTDIVVMAHSPAWHCASDPFLPTIYFCIPLLCYENVLCTENFLFIDMQSRLWLDKQLHGFSTLRWWEGKILFDMLARWIFFFFLKWNLKLSWAAIEQRENLSYLMKGGQDLCCFFLFCFLQFLKSTLCKEK